MDHDVVASEYLFIMRALFFKGNLLHRTIAIEVDYICSKSYEGVNLLW